jgi:hypothetical protein
MIYSAEVVRLGGEVEEEVVLRFNSAEITCFAGICPYQIEVRSTYKVVLTPVIFDDYSVREVSRNTPSSLIRVDESFAYEVVGQLNGRYLDAGCIVLEDEILFRDYGYLQGKQIAWKVGRIDVEFLKTGAE